MSRAFVKEQDADSVTDIPDRPISGHPSDVTPHGLAQIEAELLRARTEHAAAQADADRDAMARASREMRYWDARRATANVVPATDDTSQIRFGHTVTLARDDGRQQVYRIVGEDEADPAHGTLSHVAPLARALFGKSVGDTVRAGAHELDIIDIS
jgi:transcription elongation GreA/GreB family factor